jgi:hypothetical protein
MTATFRSKRPVEGEFPPYMTRYIAKVPDGDIVETLSRQRAELNQFLRGIPESMGDYRYGPEKWSIKEVIGHMADAERVFGYRAMRFSRADATPVEGFDENTYVANSRFAQANFGDLIDELDHLRHTSVHLFSHLDADGFERQGTANGVNVVVRSLAFIIAGHTNHHIDILKTRYLNEKSE